MAQINFPVATADGQTFEAPNGVIYTYVGTPPNGYWSGTFQDQSLQTLDGRYLKLDASNDPVTGACEFTGLTTHQEGAEFQDDVYIKNNLCVNVSTSKAQARVHIRHGAQSVLRGTNTGQFGSSNLDLVGGRNSSGVGAGFGSDVGALSFYNHRGYSGSDNRDTNAKKIAGVHAYSQSGDVTTSAAGILSFAVSPAGIDPDTGNVYTPKDFLSINQNGSVLVSDWYDTSKYALFVNTKDDADVVRLQSNSKETIAFKSDNGLGQTAGDNRNIIDFQLPVNSNGQATRSILFGSQRIADGNQSSEATQFIKSDSGRLCFNYGNTEETRFYAIKDVDGSEVDTLAYTINKDGAMTIENMIGDVTGDLTGTATNAVSVKYPAGGYGTSGNRRIACFGGSSSSPPPDSYLGLAYASENAPVISGSGEIKCKGIIGNVDNTGLVITGPVATQFTSQSGLGQTAGDKLNVAEFKLPVNSGGGNTQSITIGSKRTSDGNAGNQSQLFIQGGTGKLVFNHGSSNSTRFYGVDSSSGTEVESLAYTISRGGVMTIENMATFNLQMESDDPAAYQTTYSTDEEGNQVENQTYIGTSESLLDIIRELRSANTALEARIAALEGS